MQVLNEILSAVDVIEEFVYIYRWNILVCFIIGIGNFILFINSLERMGTILDSVAEVTIMIFALGEIFIALRMMDKELSIQMSDMIAFVFLIIFNALIIEILRFLEFLISKTREIQIKESNGEFEYVLEKLEVRKIEDDRYKIRDARGIISHCKDEEAIFKIISSEYVTYLKSNKIKIKLMSKVKYTFRKNS